MSYFRRGKARSLYEFTTQVRQRRKLKKQIDDLKVKKQETIAELEAGIKKLQVCLDSLDRNIGRFYFEEGVRFFKKKTKSIFTRFGRVWSETEKELVFLKPRKEVITSIVASGRAEEFLSLQLKEGALKKDPTFALLVGLEVREVQRLRISPPSGGDEDDDA